MQFRPIACALLLLNLAACMGWHGVETNGMRQMIKSDHPTAIRVTLRNDSIMVLDQPKMAFGDSVSGLRNGARSNVAAADITHIEVRRVNELATTAIFFGVAVGGIIAAVTLLD